MVTKARKSHEQTGQVSKQLDGIERNEKAFDDRLDTGSSNIRKFSGGGGLSLKQSETLEKFADRLDKLRNSVMLDNPDDPEASAKVAEKVNERVKLYAKEFAEELEGARNPLEARKLLDEVPYDEADSYSSVYAVSRPHISKTVEGHLHPAFTARRRAQEAAGIALDEALDDANILAN